MMNITLAPSLSFLQQGYRQSQQDARHPDTDRPDPGQRFFVVCDGVGGTAHGEVASRTVCDALAQALAHTDWRRELDSRYFGQALDKAYDALDYRARHDGERDMATTLAFVAFHGGGCTMVHIGDSRIYHLRPSTGILYRSDDHSLVNQMVHAGILTPQEALTHPGRNVVTRCMQPVADDESRSMATLMRTEDLTTGDYIFLCTDGVLHGLTDERLMHILFDATLSDEQKMDILRRESNESSDNNTATLIRISAVDGRPKGPQSESTDNGADTVRCRRGLHQMEELESVQKESLGTRVSDYFRRIFN